MEVRQAALRIQFDRFAELGDRLVEPPGFGEDADTEGAEHRHQRIEIHRAPDPGDGLIEPAHERAEPGVGRVPQRVARVEGQRSAKAPIRGVPVPVVVHRPRSGKHVSFRDLAVDRDGALEELPGLQPCVPGRGERKNRERGVGSRDAYIGRREARVPLDRLLVARDRPLKVLGTRPRVEVVTPQIERVGLRIVRVPLLDRGFLTGQESDAEVLDDGRRDFILNLEDVLQRPIELLRPEVVPLFHIDELRGDSQPVARLADAAFEHRADVQAPPDLPHVEGLALERKRGGSRHHAQILDVRQAVDQLLGDTVAEIFLILPSAHVHERQDRDRGGRSSVAPLLR